MDDNNNAFVKNVGKEELIQTFMNVEVLSEDIRNSLPLSKAEKMSLEEMGVCGGSLAAVAAIFANMVKAAKHGNNLFRAFAADGSPIAKLPFLFKDGNGAIGVIKNAAGQFRNVHWQKASTAAASSGAAVACVIAVAATIVLKSLEKQLLSIQKNTEELLKFLEEDKRAEVKANADFLADIMTNYKYNLDNETYISNMHIKVLDIKQDSAQKIEFYHKMLTGQFQSIRRIKTDRLIKEKLKKIKPIMDDYRSTLNIYAFSSFVEILLLRNFSSDYLTSTRVKMTDLANRYNKLHTDCCERLTRYFHTTINTIFVKGIANAGKFVGESIAEIPVIRKGPVDEGLIQAHSAVKRWNDNKPERHLQELNECKDSSVELFAEKIKLLDQLSNKTTELYFDEDNIYILPAS